MGAVETGKDSSLGSCFLLTTIDMRIHSRSMRRSLCDLRAAWITFRDDTYSEKIEEELKALANVMRLYCNKKGHYTSKCPLTKAQKGQALCRICVAPDIVSMRNPSEPTSA